MNRACVHMCRLVTAGCQACLHPNSSPLPSRGSVPSPLWSGSGGKGGRRSLPSSVSSSRCFALTCVSSQQFCLHVNVSSFACSNLVLFVCRVPRLPSSSLPQFCQEHLGTSLRVNDCLFDCLWQFTPLLCPLHPAKTLQLLHFLLLI